MTETSNKTRKPPANRLHLMVNGGKPGRPGNVARNILRIMKEKRTNARQVALAAGIPPSTLYSILAGDADAPRGDNIEKIAEGLGVPPAELHRGRRGRVDVDEIIAEFAASRAAAGLDPPFNEADEGHLREDGQYMWTRKRPTMQVVRDLVILLRRHYGEEDRSR